MLNVKQPIKSIFIIASALLLQACVAATIAGTTAAVAGKMGTDPRTIGTQIDDETLEEKVISAIRSDAQIREEARVSAVSYNGRVLLIGQVPQEMVKEVAKNLASGVEGVTDVYNELRVANNIAFGQISKDGWITTQVKSKMLVNEQVKATDVKVITENNEVFLMGRVTPDQADAAAEIARNVIGVQRVIKVFSYLN